MARPRKDNLDYFPLDVGLLSNAKMMMAINQVGSDAVAVYVAVLGAVYAKSYWLPRASSDLQVLPSKLHMPVNRFNTAYDALVEWGLINEISAETDDEKTACPGGVAVTSRGMQEQYFAIKTRVISEKLPFLVIKPPETDENDSF